MFPILQLDIAGNPADWISHRQAITMMAREHVIANLGEQEKIFKGGYNRLSGIRSIVTVSTIVLTKERVMGYRLSRVYEPPYSHKVLFARDRYRCLYCGETFAPADLTRDHIIPKSRGGSDSWSNSATACRCCNHSKDNRTPEEWGHLLLEVPYIPNWAEFLYLNNTHRIVMEQQVFLQERFQYNSPLLM